MKYKSMWSEGVTEYLERRMKNGDRKIARFTCETNGGKAIFGERKRGVYAEMHRGGSNRDDGTCFGGM